jgi:hypothetical protein
MFLPFRAADSSAMIETDAERYRKQADDCRQEAEKAIRPLDRDRWLKLAHALRRLRRGRPELSRRGIAEPGNPILRCVTTTREA